MLQRRKVGVATMIREFESQFAAAHLTWKNGGNNTEVESAASGYAQARGMLVEPPVNSNSGMYVSGSCSSNGQCSYYYFN